MNLAEAVLAGERLALARLLTQVENDSPEGRAALDVLFAHTGRAHIVGITGASGTGKSSLVNQLAKAYRHPNDGSASQRIAILAVDPSSPFTGGALLGDRLRMRDLSGDPGVFIRSMASRGALGGLARTTAAAAQVLDAAGFDVVLIETVGAGQSEVDIARLAHTTVVVEAPGLGDDIQANKAGILEIADILVVNKADRPGVESTERALKSMLELGHPMRHMAVSRHHHSLNSSLDRPPNEAMSEDEGELWVPPVLKTNSTLGTGVEEVRQQILRHNEYLHRSGEWQNREQARLQNELELLLQAGLVTAWQARTPAAVLEQVSSALYRREISPAQAVERLIREKQQ